VSDGPGRELSSASVRESLSFTLRAMLPNLIQGLFRRRPKAVAAANRLDVDRRAVETIAGIRDRHGPGPVWVRAGGDRMLLCLSTEDARRTLEGSPEPFAPDPEAKRKGMSHFQPDALTISRGEAWRNRRRFAEAVLDTGQPLHRLADRFLEIVRAEIESLLTDLDSRSAELDWDAFNRTGWRITRRIVLGDEARDDDHLTELLWTLMVEANKLPDEDERSEHLDPYLERIRTHIERSEAGSLVGLFAEAPSDAETKTDRQVTHWLFAMGDTLFANSFRALALIATHPRQRALVEAELGEGEGLDDAGRVASLTYLEACLEEAMRLWPTTPLLSRETLEETEWNGASVPAGTQILISNTFSHRDAKRHSDANRFNPEVWSRGQRGEDWTFNHFSNGPQGCPGAGLAVFVGKAVLAELLSRRRIHLLEPSLDPERPLPHMLDFFRLRFALE
jgi:cytochrome P450